MSTIPTMFEIISMYLYGQKTKPEDYLDEKYIGRPVHGTDKIGSSIHVNASEFMTTSAGRYVQVGNFPAILKFLAGEYNDKLEKGTTYNFLGLLKQIGSTSSGNLDISNYCLDTSSADYLDRAYVFGSMKFKINDTAEFHYNEDGTLTITNIAVVPEDDNFDYDGGVRPTYEQHIKKYFKNLESWFVELPGNKINSIVTDPSNIGLKVSINYISDVENIGSNNLLKMQSFLRVK